MLTDDFSYVINPEGTKATVTITDDSNSHDSGYWTFCVWLKFADLSLNPPGQDSWHVGEFNEHYSHKDKIEQEVRIASVQFYNFLMKFRTAYALEDTVNEWRKKGETDHEEILERQRKIQDLTDQLRWREARIKELETDRVKHLEDENSDLRARMRGAADRLSKLAVGLSK